VERAGPVTKARMAEIGVESSQTRTRGARQNLAEVAHSGPMGASSYQ